MAEREFKFDFEHVLPVAAQTAPSLNLTPAMRKNFRQTVCRHWMKSMCMKGDDCGFLHQWETSRMPVCRHFAKNGECHELNCVFKHSLDDIKECNMYKLGFCIHGQLCKYRHTRLPGPPPDPTLVVRANIPSASERDQSNAVPPALVLGDARAEAQDGAAAGALSRDLGLSGGALVLYNPDTKTTGAPVLALGTISGSDPASAAVSSAQLPPAGATRYFLMKSNSLENLEQSVRLGVWATHQLNEPKLNEAHASTPNVLLFFSVNTSRHFQGVARMASRVGEVGLAAQWQGDSGGASLHGRNFKLQWLKLSDLAFIHTQHLMNNYNEGKPVKVGRDCQEIESNTGAQLVRLLYQMPDSAFQAMVNQPPATIVPPSASASDRGPDPHPSTSGGAVGGGGESPFGDSRRSYPLVAGGWYQNPHLREGDYQNPHLREGEASAGPKPLLRGQYDNPFHVPYTYSPAAETDALTGDPVKVSSCAGKKRDMPSSRMERSSKMTTPMWQ